MNVGALVVAIGTMAFSYLIVGAVCRFAIDKNLLDVPNARSSHVVATPRGGGLGIAIAFLAALGALWSMGLVSGTLWLALIISSSAVALVGYLDDRHTLGARSRFIVHFFAAMLFVGTTGGYPTEELFRWGLHGAWLGSAFSVLALVWSTNLFNFMDGIDGLAASEAIFITASAGALILFNGGGAGLSAVLFSLSAATVGFLFWNWPPARIFMGDVGSGFLGFVTCACLMVATIKRILPIEVLPILGGVFVVDATTTLIRRVLQGDNWLEPHRTHAYQWLSRRYGGHRRVTLLSAGVNVIWLLPWAMATVRAPANARLYLASALLPLVIIAIMIGSGRRESKTAAP